MINKVLSSLRALLAVFVPALRRGSLAIGLIALGLILLVVNLHDGSHPARPLASKPTASRPAVQTKTSDTTPTTSQSAVQSTASAPVTSSAAHPTSPTPATPLLTLSSSSITVTSGATVKSGYVTAVANADIDGTYFSVSSAPANLFTALPTKLAARTWSLEIKPAMVQGVAPGVYPVSISAYGPNRTTYTAQLTITVVASDDLALNVYANYPASGDVKRIDVVLQRYNGNTQATQGISLATTPAMACSLSYTSGLNSSYESRVYYCTRSSAITSFSVYVEMTVGGRNLVNTQTFSF